MLAAAHIFPEGHSCSVWPSLAIIVLVLREVQVGLHPQGQRVMRTSGMLQALEVATSALLQAAFTSHSSLLPSLSPLLSSPLLSPHFPLPPSLLSLSSLLIHSPVLWGSRKEGGFSKITIAFSSTPTPTSSSRRAKQRNLHLGLSRAEHLKEELILCRISKSF